MAVPLLPAAPRLDGGGAALTLQPPIVKHYRDGKPLCKIYTEIPPEYEPYTGRFWPWRESEITDVVHACPNVRYYVDAYDYYHNHVFPLLRT